MLLFRALGELLSTKVNLVWMLYYLIFWPDMSVLGQKCSALSRLYVSSSAWNGGFKDQFLTEIAKIKVGPLHDWGKFVGPVM